MATQAALGHKALDAKDYQAAITHLTSALETGSTAPTWYIDRSIAYQRTSQYQLALEDAENALRSAKSRGRRELMATAQFRRAVALHSLGRYGDARMVLTWAQKLNDKERGIGLYQAKVVADFEKLDESDEKRLVSVVEYPEKKETEVKQREKQVTAPAPSITPTASTPAAPITVRQEWLQSSTKVTITLYAKGIPKDKAEVEITESSLIISFPTSSSTDYNYSLLPLFAEIDPSQSTYNISPYKLEVNLHKKVAGQKWAALEGTAMEKSDVETEDAVTKESQVQAPARTTVDKVPSYPTSAKNKIDWNKMDVEDEDDDSGGADAFFNKLYKNADPDTKRAMIKSMQESNGTTLSTDWKDVGSRTIETKPPEGVQEVKWTK